MPRLHLRVVTIPVMTIPVMTSLVMKMDADVAEAKMKMVTTTKAITTMKATIMMKMDAVDAEVRHVTVRKDVAVPAGGSRDVAVRVGANSGVAVLADGARRDDAEVRGGDVSEVRGGDGGAAVTVAVEDRVGAGKVGADCSRV